MNRLLRQTALGFGTFGTGCALLALNVNPYLLVITDAMVGVGMLFAAGSLSVNDLPLKRRGETNEGAAAGPEGVAGDADEIPSGLLASLGKLKASVKSAPGGKGKEGKEAQVKEIDRMLDATLAGGSKRLISLAEGQGAAPLAGRASAAAGHEENLLDEFSKAEIGAPFGDEEEGEGVMPGQAAPAAAGPASLQEAGTAPLPGLGEIRDAAARADAAPEPEDLDADDLLSALRREAMKEKKKDDTSLLRDLQGVKVSGRQLLDELDSLVRDMRGR